MTASTLPVLTSESSRCSPGRFRLFESSRYPFRRIPAQNQQDLPVSQKSPSFATRMFGISNQVNRLERLDDGPRKFTIATYDINRLFCHFGSERPCELSMSRLTFCPRSSLRKRLTLGLRVVLL